MITIKDKWNIMRNCSRVHLNGVVYIKGTNKNILSILLSEGGGVVVEGEEIQILIFHIPFIHFLKIAVNIDIFFIKIGNIYVIQFTFDVKSISKVISNFSTFYFQFYLRLSIVSSIISLLFLSFLFICVCY